MCGTNDVDYPGGVCELCSIGQDPFAAGTGNTRQVVLNKPSNTVPPAGGSGKSRKILLNANSTDNNSVSTSSGSAAVPSNPQNTSVKVYQAGQVPAVSTSTVSSSPAPAATVSGAL